MKPLFSTLAFTFLLGACVEGTQPSSTSADPLTKAISGKTVVNDNFQATLGSNGSFNGSTPDGTVFKGAWAVRNGQFCRTLTEPESFVGTECQMAELDDGTITITGRNGPVKYQIK